jgi:hypothetical protein
VEGICILLFFAISAGASITISHSAASSEWIRPHSSLSFNDRNASSPQLLRSVKNGLTKGSVVTYFGEDVSRFREAFASLGVVKS